MRLQGRWAGLALVLVLLPATALTALRLLDLDSGRAVRMVSFTPYALPAYCLAGLLLGIALVGRRTLRRVLVLLLVLAGLVLHCWWVAPLVSGERPTTTGEPLTVLTSNLLMGQGDGLEVLRVATEEEVDVLVLQEVTEGSLDAMERAGLAEAYPHRIGEAVPEGRTDGTMVLSRTPMGEPERLGTDMQSWAVDVVGPRGEPVRLLAVHPAAPVDPGAWRRDHLAILEAATADDADLVVGDLNATLDHAPIRALLDAGFRDVTEQANAGWQPTWPSNGLFESLPLPALVQIDHVLVGRRWAGVSSRAVHVTGTDHRALLAQVSPVG